MHLFLKLIILVKRSTCFGRSFRPSGAQNCVYSNRYMSNSRWYLLLLEMRWNCSSISSLLAAGSSSCLTYTSCCIRSFELLMMDRTAVPSRPWSQQVAAAVWHILVAVYPVLSSWWWTERPSKTCRAFYKNKWFEKQLHLVGCTIGIYYDARTYEC